MVFSSSLKLEMEEMGHLGARNWKDAQLLGSARKWSSAQPESGAYGCGNLAPRGVLRHSFTLEEMKVLGRCQGPRTLTKPDRPYSESHKKDIRINWLERV